MSANINKFCAIKNLEDLKVILVPEEKTKHERLRDEDWDNRWNWDTSELMKDEDETATQHLWLAECKIALSPLTDMMVVGRNRILSIYNFKHNSNSEDNVHDFNLVYNTSLPGLEPDETLTSILLLPFVAPQKQRLVNLRDWTAILVGFSSGFFRIYSENGKVLLSHLFHDEPILGIKCRSHTANYLFPEQVDEILLIYPSAVIQIDGFTLFQTLRMCRNNLAKSNNVDSAGVGYFSSLTDGGNNNQEAFTFKKWSFTTENGQIQDCVNVCNYVKNDFDALVTRSIAQNQLLDNYSANLFFTTGTHPFVGFFRANEGTTHTILDELSQVLLNKVKNVFSFLSSAKSTKESNPREKIKPATAVECNIGLFDERLGFKICLSPNRRLAAVVDDFGRVILFDVANGIAVRIWKGYRRAEVAWIVVEEEGIAQKDYPKQALFLVIYAPKRGILEIWCAQNGPRVTAFKVGKNCKLIYIDHVMFGLNHLMMQNIKQTMTQAEYSKTFFATKCFLINYETGELFNIDVPFLCSLTDRNSKKTRDIHILKDLKILLKKQDNLIGEKMDKYRQQVTTLVVLLKTAEIRREFLEELVKLTNDEQLIHMCAQKIYQTLLKSIEKNELDFENKLVAQMCARIMQLCNTYSSIKQKMPALIVNADQLVKDSVNPPDIHQLVDELGGWSGNNVARIFSLLAFRQSVLKSPPQSLSTEIGGEEFTVSNLLSHFTLYYTHLVKRNNEEIYERLPVEVVLMSNNNQNATGGKQASNESKLVTYVALGGLSRFLFNASFCGDEGNLDYLLKESCIYSSNLLLLLFTSWLESSYSNHWCCWQNLTKPLLKLVDIMTECQQNEDDLEGNVKLFDSTYDDRLLAPSWAEIIELIYRSTNITSALICVNMIGALVNKFKQTNYKQTSVSKVDSETVDSDEGAVDSKVEEIHNASFSSEEWETLHLDKENLILLTKQLEDLFLLDMLLKSNLCSPYAMKPQRKTSEAAEPNDATSFLNLDDPLPRFTSMSLSFMLTSGPGIVSEIVACWAVHHKISPELLICSPSAEASLLNENESITLANEQVQLKRNMEGSTTEVSTLAEDSDRATLMEILDHVRRCFPNCLESDILLINCCWELLLQWNSKPMILSGELCQTLDYLERVSSSVLKHNIASMGWRLFIQKRFETLCNLIEKMGRKPKDRICRKELEMDENNMEQFVFFCRRLLDFMFRTSFSSESEPMPLYMLDDWWCHFNASNEYSNHYADSNSPRKAYIDQMATSNRPQQTKPFSTTTNFDVSPNTSNLPLAMIAMNQKVANVDLVNEYMQLADAVLFTVNFTLKNARPLSLFSSSVRAYFFKDLHNFLPPGSIESISGDPVLRETRYKFLDNVITAIVLTLPFLKDEDKDVNRREGNKYFVSAQKWFNKVIGVAREWYLELDRVRLRFVCDLFLYGCDLLGEEQMIMVTNVGSMGRKLLLIAAQRAMHIFVTQFGSVEELTLLPPNVVFWLKSLVTDPNCNLDCPKSWTITLLERITRQLHEDDSNYRICLELLTTLKNV